MTTYPTIKIKHLIINKKKITSDEIIKKNMPPHPIIFDVGANKGQSINRFRDLCKDPQIHSFEPLRKEFEFLKQNFKVI